MCLFSNNIVAKVFNIEVKLASLQPFKDKVERLRLLEVEMAILMPMEEEIAQPRIGLVEQDA